MSGRQINNGYQSYVTFLKGTIDESFTLIATSKHFEIKILYVFGIRCNSSLDTFCIWYLHEYSLNICTQNRKRQLDIWKKACLFLQIRKMPMKGRVWKKVNTLTDTRVPGIWSKFEFLNYQLEYEIIRKFTMKNAFRLILALTETRLHHFEVWISQ